ncbi:hypothetical protein BR93DRAFT_931691 [Coniochaeta sp. PMI_546]|nr:hypothetical protein BR93DRAFT_931691 [Coniochaeta sp. PMI_546]
MEAIRRDSKHSRQSVQHHQKSARASERVHLASSRCVWICFKTRTEHHTIMPARGPGIDRRLYSLLVAPARSSTWLKLTVLKT